MEKIIVNQEFYQTMFLNNIIYDQNMRTKLKNGIYNPILTIELLKKIKELINKNKQENFIDLYVSNQILELVNYCRFKLKPNTTKEEIYEICNEIIIYLNKINDKFLNNESYRYYFYQVLVRNIDPFFNYGDVNYHVVKNRNTIYESISYDLDVYQALNSQEYKQTQIYDKIQTYKPYSEIINMVTYSIRALSSIHPSIFNKQTTIDNIKQTLQIQKQYLMQYKKAKNQSWYMELEINAKTLQRVLNK